MSVYFATAGRYTKIGFSDDPISRFGTVTRNGTRPADLPHKAEAELLGWIPGDRAREGWFHHVYREARVEGEWFVLDEAIVREVIWDDPAGVDIQRMTAVAVLLMSANPSLTRADVAAAGALVEAPPLENVFAAFNAHFAAIGGAR